MMMFTYATATVNSTRFARLFLLRAFLHFDNFFLIKQSFISCYALTFESFLV